MNHSARIALDRREARKRVGPAFICLTQGAHELARLSQSFCEVVSENGDDDMSAIGEAPAITRTFRPFVERGGLTIPLAEDGEICARVAAAHACSCVNSICIALTSTP